MIYIQFLTCLLVYVFLTYLLWKPSNVYKSTKNSMVFLVPVTHLQQLSVHAQACFISTISRFFPSCIILKQIPDTIADISVSNFVLNFQRNILYFFILALFLSLLLGFRKTGKNWSYWTAPKGSHKNQSFTFHPW